MTTSAKRLRNFLAGLFATAMLAGCAAVGPDFEKPAPPTPTAWIHGQTAEAAADLKWWQLFDDPVLFQLVTRALAHNRDLLIAASRMEQARAVLGFTRADPYPRVDIEAGAGTGNFTGGNRSETTNRTAYLAPTLKWEIDFWGKFRRASQAARAELMASEFAYKTVQLSLVAQVAGTYYLLLDYHERLEIAFQTLESRLKSLSIIQQRYDSGLIPEIDLNQAQIQKEVAAGAIPLYQRQIAKTENSLSILAGRLPAEIDIGTRLIQQPTPPDIPTGLPSRLIERRPDLAQATYLLEAQTARIGVAKAQRLPAFSLTGALGLASTELASVTSEGGAWSIGGSLLGPLIDFDKNRQRVQVEVEKTRQVRYEYENAVLNAFREVEDALVELDTFKKQIRIVARKQAAALNAKRLAVERYDKGVSSYLEVLDADRTLFSVQLELVELRQQYLGAYVNLYKAMGGGWIIPAPNADRTPQD